MLLFLPSARSWLLWVQGLGLDLNFCGGSGLRGAPGRPAPTLTAAANGTRARKAFIRVKHAEGRTAGGAVGCSWEGCFGCIRSHGRTGPPGSSPVIGPGWHRHGPGHGLCSSHCTVTSCRPGFRLPGLLGSLNCKRETTWVGPRTLQNTLFIA